jgi:hypothetical protein
VLLPNYWRCFNSVFGLRRRMVKNDPIQKPKLAALFASPDGTIHHRLIPPQVIFCDQLIPQKAADDHVLQKSNVYTILANGKKLDGRWVQRHARATPSPIVAACTLASSYGSCTGPFDWLRISGWLGSESAVYGQARTRPQAARATPFPGLPIPIPRHSGLSWPWTTVSPPYRRRPPLPLPPARLAYTSREHENAADGGCGRGGGALPS